MAIHVDPPRRPRFREKDETTSYLDGLWSWLYQLAEKLNAQQDTPTQVINEIHNVYTGGGGKGGTGSADIIVETVTITNISAAEHHFPLERVKDTMAVLECVFSKPGNVSSDLTISTGEGAIDITGTFYGQTDITLTLGTAKEN